MIAVERTFSGWIESCPFEQRARFALSGPSTSAPYYAHRNTQALISAARADASTTDDRVHWSVP